MQEIALARASAFAPQLADFQQQQQQQQAAQQQQDGPGSGGGGGGSPKAEGQQLLDELAMSALDRVLIVKPGSLEALRVTLGALEEQVPLRGVRLVVLDSVAALLRTELGGGRTQVDRRGRGWGGLGVGEGSAETSLQPGGVRLCSEGGGQL
jgi:RecA/RadA recombinase